jgi:hypothetical protein
MLRDAIQEVRQLGIRGSVFRAGWEFRARLGLTGRLTGGPPRSGTPSSNELTKDWPTLLPYADPSAVAEAMRPRIPAKHLDQLRRDASDAVEGNVRCFGRWVGHFGKPIDWHRNPATGIQWNAQQYWTKALAERPGHGDIKLLWEAARFPHAYHIARAAAFFPDVADKLSHDLLAQITAFIAENPVGRGVHWSSGQELTVRCMAWLFATDVLLLRQRDTTQALNVIGPSVREHTRHVGQNVEYARLSVYNNHLLAEALLLFVHGALFTGESGSRRLRRFGAELLVDESGRQFYDDGGYIQLSHNYHRAALQYMCLACAFSKSTGTQTSSEWLGAMTRSLDFLVAHQNPADGRLPNYGSNDGSLPAVLSTCDYTDFRPTLQAVSVACRGERLYDAGPWDEEAVWLFGPACLDLPLRRLTRRSTNFRSSGFHVLRSRRDDTTFAAFRCGSVKDRFSQIDMLHVDVFWRGHNVLLDGGSYLYNAGPEWHNYFMETGIHNTVTVDGLDQMQHHRKFTCLYWTQAKLLAFERHGAWMVATGEHYGYTRHPGACVHRRSLAFHDSGLGVVRDSVVGTAWHRIGLHWLGGPYPWTFDPGLSEMRLGTGSGEFSLRVVPDRGSVAAATVVAGRETPPRGWSSRYYGEKVPVPSFLSHVAGTCPLGITTVFGPDQVRSEAVRDGIEIETSDGSYKLSVTDSGALRPS